MTLFSYKERKTQNSALIVLAFGMIAASTYTIFSRSQLLIVLFHSIAPQRLSPINRSVFITNQKKHEMKTLF
jgi:hypothetical protein